MLRTTVLRRLMMLALPFFLRACFRIARMEGAHVSGGLSHRRPKRLSIRYRQSPSAPRRATSLAEPRGARACRRDLCHQLTSPARSGRYRRNEHMARLGLQRQAELEIALELGGDLGVISDGSPVFRDEHGLGGVQAHHRADLAGVKSLNQRRDHAFGFSRE
jgi:hypothetical protein